MISSTRILDDTVPALLFPDGPQSLIHRWREVVAAVPDVRAVVDPGDGDRPGASFTFAEVDRLSDLLAFELVATIGASDLPTAAMLGHDSHAAIALMALLKTGKLRVVLDTHLPAERLRQIVELAGSRVLLVDDRHVDLASAIDFDTRLSLDSLLAKALESTATAEEIAARVTTELALGESRHGTDTLEIVFTSGSTGTPKGVLQRHNSLLNDYYSYREIRNLGAGDPVAMVSPLSFVAGSGLLLTTVLNGSTACLIDPRDTGVPALLDFLKEQEVAGLDCTPHLIRGIVGGLAAGEILPRLRYVGTFGEAIHRRDLRNLLSHLGPDAKVVNEVGATEINSLAAYVVHQGDELPEGNLPAGRVLDGKSVRLVDENGDDVQDGETGELIVVSQFHSGGYWNNDELNAEKFGVDAEGRDFVRQGDLARIRPDGNLQLLGRANGGVKVRGYLVEPSEIEGALLSLEDIAETAVTAVVTPDRPTRLVAYVVPSQIVRTPSSAAIRRSLRAVLPEYMVPSEIIQLTSLPRTERGKVDRQALPPVPERSVDVSGLSPNEVAMAEVWQDVLELPAIGPDDDFMALGGDSLSVEELAIRIKDRFGKDIHSSDVLTHPTLREFTDVVLTTRASAVSRDDHVVFNASDAGTPLFAFAGATALALTFLPLSKHLAGHPVYTFQQHALERRALPDRSIEAVAARHVKTMRALHPEGPYSLIGHSYGGVVALEAARQLTEAGQTVDSVVILDTYLPNRAQEPSAEAAPETRPTLVQRVLPDGLPARENVARQIRARLAGVVRFGGERHYDAMMDLVILMFRRYQLKPYAGRTALVIAHDNPDGAQAWNSILTGERVDIQLGTEHDSLLREPHVETVAMHVRPFLEGR